MVKETVSTDKTGILSIGEVLFDIYQDQSKIGGAPFNFIYHIYKLTGQGRFISRVGNDSLGNRFLDFLTEQHMNNQYVGIDPKHPTGTAHVKLSEEKIPSFSIADDVAYDHIEYTPEIERYAIASAALLYIGTLAQRNAQSRACVENLYSKPIRVLYDVNLRQHYYTDEIIGKSLSAAHIVKLNLDELRLINEMFFNIPFDLYQSVADLIKVFRSELVCVTLGADGAMLSDGDFYTSYRIPDVTVMDTVGAGDGFAAILGLGYLNRWDLQTLIVRASEFAAEICQIPGALLPDETYQKYERWFR